MTRFSPRGYLLALSYVSVNLPVSGYTTGNADLAFHVVAGHNLVLPLALVEQFDMSLGRTLTLYAACTPRRRANILQPRNNGLKVPQVGFGEQSV
jgi:hypothetical protein